MKQKQMGNLLLLVLLMSFFVGVWMHSLQEQGELSRLNGKTLEGIGFRGQVLPPEMVAYLQKQETNKGRDVGLYLLESKFSYQSFARPYKENTFDVLEKKWEKRPAYQTYLSYSNAIWNDVKYFPVPLSTTDDSLTTAFSDSWMTARTYGGDRGHEGTDIMAGKNETGLYPVVSMTDGIVLSKGWLDQGGYRILIQAPGKACFYYAHLASYAAIKEGDTISAGDIIGFMGDTGYGKKEGTRGKFPVHLHIGCYIYSGGKEISVNPYWILTYLENFKLKCAYS